MRGRVQSKVHHLRSKSKTMLFGKIQDRLELTWPSLYPTPIKNIGSVFAFFRLEKKIRTTFLAKAGANRITCVKPANSDQDLR